MNGKKLAAIILIYIATFIAWMILGVSNMSRSDTSYRGLKLKVANLFGDEVIVNAPKCFSKTKRFSHTVVDGKKVISEYFTTKNYEIANSNIHVKITLDPRKKGNLWFPTYKAKYSGEYEFHIKDKSIDNTTFYVLSSLESINSIYNNIRIVINGKELDNILSVVKKEKIVCTPDENGNIKLSISYDCTGMERLNYYISPKREEIAQINNFKMTIITDFDDYDFPDKMMSPTEKNKLEKGYELIWSFTKSVTGKDIGITIPKKLNPGEIVSRVTFFAPVSLLFFIVVIFLFSLKSKINLHPMHYFFLSATFFSFHLMYSYISDHLNIYLTFCIASVVSLFLTVTYLRLFSSKKLSYFYAPLIQFIYLIIFSYSFFFKGVTGLIVTICSVITLFILMQATAKLNWDEIFSNNKQI